MDGQNPLATATGKDHAAPRINIFAPTPTATQQSQSGTAIAGAASLDLSQLTPVVAAYQEGEVAKARIAHEAQLSIAEMSTKRQMEGTVIPQPATSVVIDSKHTRRYFYSLFTPE